MSEIDELIRLSKILTERDGQRLYNARNSPAIVKLDEGRWGKLWIKRFHGRFTITLAFPDDNARTCIYDEQPGEETVKAKWSVWLRPFLTTLRRRLVLDVLADV